MKKLIMLILLAGVFLGGYYLGQQPDSPDIFGWAQKSYHRVADAGHQIAAIVGDEPEKAMEVFTQDKEK